MRDKMDQRSHSNKRRSADASNRSSAGEEPHAHSNASNDAFAIERPAASSSVQVAMGDWLRRLPWNAFATLTLAAPVHPEQAHKRYMRWIAALTRHPARRAAHGPVIWARGTELQGRGVIHFHALIAGVAPIPVFAASKLWEQIGGGYARIYPYTWSLGAAYYFGKDGDVDFSSTWFDE
jgi:hypothetical protein